VLLNERFGFTAVALAVVTIVVIAMFVPIMYVLPGVLGRHPSLRTGRALASAVMVYLYSLSAPLRNVR
jgi:hypothetical protein